MQDFLDSIHLEIRAQNSQAASRILTPSIKFKRTDLRVQAYSINTHFRYLLKNSTYILEITRSQKTVKPVQGNAQKPGTTWKVSMYNREWDSILEQQANLQIGQKGAWEVDLDHFFPAQNSTLR